MTTLPGILRIGTRTSALALAQAEIVRHALLKAYPTYEAKGRIEIVPMMTTGDKFQRGPLMEIGGKGLFTKELEDALLADRIDLAVHSLKDMTAFLPPALIIAAVLERADPRDALVSHQASSIKDLPKGARVGTSSLRRQAQLLMQRPDLSMTVLRGNVPSRLKKLNDGEAAATILAMAGLKRLGIAEPYITPLPVDEMLPAVAQGALGIECREDNTPIREILNAITHTPSQQCTAAEREMLAVLDGSCRTPIAGYAELRNESLHLRGMVIAPDGSKQASGERTGTPEDALRLGKDLGEELKQTAPPGILAHA